MKSSLGAADSKMRLNEEEIIALIWSKLSRGKHARRFSTLDPFADDVAWLRNDNAKLLVIKSDMFVSETDAPSQMSPKQMASKALTACVSDFAAKGVQPCFATVSLAISKSESTYEFVSSLAVGIYDTSRRYGFEIISGDTNASKSGLVIDCTIGGYAERIVTRRDAMPGNLIGVSGGFGLQSAGLKLLVGKFNSGRVFKKRAVDTVLNPKARLKLGLAIAGHLTSSIDSSDGLALSLYHLAESSGVNLQLDRLPLASGVSEFAKMNSLDPEDLVLFGGEEYELVFTFDEEDRLILSKYGVIEVGSVISKSKNPKVRYASRILPRKGWIHNI